MLPLFISLCVKHLYPDQLNGDMQLVLPKMVIAHTSIGLQILFFGSLLSAVMSTTSSSILAPSAVLSENIIKPNLKKKLTDRQLLIMTRISVVIVSAISTIMACWKTNIYELVAGASILSLVSQFIPLTLGLYWKKASAAGAIASMLSGLATWGLFELYPISVPSLVPALVVGLAVMVFVSLMVKNR
jgi:Na+/proline symporter